MTKDTPKNFATVTTPQTPNAKTSILIAMDTAYIGGQGGGRIGQGIYMFDDQASIWGSGGNSSEGSLKLSTKCHIGDIISFECVLLDPTRGDTTTITGIDVSQGNVFGSAGYPKQWSGTNLWFGQAMNAGSQSYQIFVQIVTGGIRPQRINLHWDAFISAQ
jgi:hypothetical protein